VPLMAKVALLARPLNVPVTPAALLTMSKTSPTVDVKPSARLRERGDAGA